jgi:glycosyltransferase involved in cell wall biosynthesis
LRRLSVLHVVSVPGIGGAQAYVETVIQRLGELGYRPAVVCNAEPALVARYTPCAKVFPIPIAYRASPWYDLRFFVRLLCLLRRERFDIIQTSAAKASLYGRLAARLAGVPVVIFTAHGFPFHHFMRRLLRWGLMALEKAMSRWCTDMVVSVSEADRRYAIAKGIVPAHRIVTIQNGIDVNRPIPQQDAARHALALAPQAPVVGMVGRLSRQKAPEDFLRAAALVAQEFPEAIFLVAGDGPLRSRLERLAMALGIANQVRFLGFRDDIPLVMAALNVFVLCSLWEGLPLTVLEAMAASRAVVATAVNGVAEVVQDGCTGLLAPPQGVQQLAAHIAALLRDPARARAMGEAGRRRVCEQFSIERTVAQLSELYQELFRAKRPPDSTDLGQGVHISDQTQGPPR